MPASNSFRKQKFTQIFLLKLVEKFGLFFFKKIISRIESVEVIGENLFTEKKFGESWELNFVNPKEPYLLCCWHSELLFPIWAFRGGGMNTIVSQSFDGELVTTIMEKLNYQIVRGSSHKGGFSAFKESYKILQNGFPLAITPDGPTGPNKKVKQGICELSEKLKIPILPIRIFSSKPKRLNSWDKFLIPKGKVRVVFGEVLFPETTSENLEQKMEELEKWDF
ncbi:MAG: DUF374 domain-containing protein [Calditrichaeota bacterium]|nr:MAG: DUF374 domain-containing protein [Calditrichota bacterium]